ncbi:glycosyltransferase family 4 protein [Christiangramia sabulilitoris]|uniref:Glycosyltransferase family 4 protein n=1 Tax=Christiangramia sabulilitoris TaxID=2583991 RepID=A0A550HYY3_9FLAO|nr:glycosyltransferase family 4 protein [Christiangramia sabulilitoris]TRO63900.1 glycosyltransferase family 4 protein [Christiangramia sabulilitoris]
MHIAFLTPEYPHQLTGSSGGLGTSIKNLASSLCEKGVEVSVILYGQESEMEFEDAGISFYFLRQKRYKIGGWFFYRKYIKKSINNLIRKKNIDVIEAPDWTGITALIDFKCSLVIRLHGTDAYFCELEGRQQKWKNRIFEKKALEAADFLISVSRFTAEKTNEIFGINREYEIIPNSIETRSFVPSDVEIVPGRILYFGTIIRKKGVLELAEIFNKVIIQRPESDLVLIGNDVIDNFDNRSTFELFKNRLSKQAEEKMNYLGKVEYDKIKAYIQESAVVVLPSFAEALPMTWIEAMALEKALVTSDIGWAEEVMVDGETGFTVDPKNYDAYADRIIKLLDDGELRRKMGSSARKRVIENFAAEKVVEKNIEFYKLVIEKSKALDLSKT